MADQRICLHRIYRNEGTNSEPKLAAGENFKEGKEDGARPGKQQKQTKEQIEQLEKERREVRNRMTELRSKLPAEYERHGWVWLFPGKKI